MLKDYPEQLNPTIKLNDKVYYKRWGGETIKEDGKEYVIIEFKDILAVIE